MGPLESLQASAEKHAATAAGPRVRRKRSSRLRKLDLAVLVVLVVLLALSATPWPSAMVIRSVFERGAQATIDEMTPYVPDTPLQTKTGIAYKPGSTFDAFTPAGTAAPLPAVVWIHGGAWISGAQRDVEPYLRILAAEGYTTIGLSYPIAPEATYPTAVRDINDALAYIK
ncbi:alpha/beta hydrolase, partial [Paenarthrobacter sp. RAF9]